jgi:hypothetical protein
MRAPARSIYLTAALLLGGPSPAFATPAMTATATANATHLGLDGQGSASTHIVKVAALSLSTDGANGLTVSIASGSLTKAGGSSVAFQVALVDHNATAPSAAAFMTASGGLYTFSTEVAAMVEKDLYIKYRPAALQDPGGYIASIDIQVDDNP